MTQVPNLEDIAAELEAQNAELAAAVDLAETMPERPIVDEGFLQAFDDVTEPPSAIGHQLLLTPGIRA